MERLPGLQSVVTQGLRFHKSDNESSGCPQSSDLVLSKLESTSFYADPSEHDYYLDFLALFASIEELEIKEERPHKRLYMAAQEVPEISLASAVVFPVGKLQCRKLTLGRGIYASSFIPAFLQKIDGLRCLSSLSLRIGPPVETLTLFDELLRSVGKSLTYLEVAFTQGPEWFELHDSSRRRIWFVEHIQDGLSACTALEVLKFSNIVLSRTYTSIEQRERRFAVFCCQTWLSAISFLLHVQTDQLRHLTVGLDSGVDHHDDSHSLPWSKMRDAVRRFTHLRSLRLSFFPYGCDERPCVAYEMQEYKEFLKIPHTSFSYSYCTHTSCRAYKLKSDCDTESCLQEEI
ncbi:hypothetical protein BDY19DRAFT_21181 [Irpex rosettiformis]|uniref:Uncharacterized protein n=1 Tax=Irpex rosettiformis TaxID=378272 RepID=A0ACB8UK12_9APHY|nr:hypothetical protein BDY19DRAFT_21181 [Irpex rosettiformis]